MRGVIGSLRCYHLFRFPFQGMKGSARRGRSEITMRLRVTTLTTRLRDYGCDLENVKRKDLYRQRSRVVSVVKAKERWNLAIFVTTL